VSIVFKNFCDRGKSCRDPRDADLCPAGGPLSAAYCGIGPSISTPTTTTLQSAKNQQVAVSGGGTAIGAKTYTLGNVGKGAASIIGAGNTVTTIGKGAKISTSTNTSTNTNVRSTVSNSNNVTNSGTYQTTNIYGDDAAALEAVTNQGAQSEDAIATLGDTITHAIAGLGSLVSSTPAAAANPIYVTTPAATQDGTAYVGQPQSGISGLTTGEVVAIIAAIAAIGIAMIVKK